MIRPHLANAEWKLLNDMVNEVNGNYLRVFFIEIEGANTGYIRCLAGHCKEMSREESVAVY